MGEGIPFRQITWCSNVVYQGIKPDIADIVTIEWQLYAPLQPGFWSGNAEIAQRLLQEAEVSFLRDVG